MNLGHWSYLIYMLAFTIPPLIIVWAKKYSFLLKNWRIIIGQISIGIFYLFIPNVFAHNWNAWFFDPQKTLDIRIVNFPIEDAPYEIIVITLITSATLVFIYYQEKGKFKKLFKM